VGRPLQDLEVSYRPVELRSRIEEAYAQRHPIAAGEVDWPSPAGEERTFEVQVIPLVGQPGDVVGAGVSFIDVTRYRDLRGSLEEARRQAETAYEELQSTVEELETTNEELQSTNEELETTNEELQSTNEELETMNEELQSTNEELEAINDELRLRTDELNSTNTLMEAILTGVELAVIVVNRELQVQVWNHLAEDLWGLRQDEVKGHHFLNLDTGLPVDQLSKPLRDCLTGKSSSVEVTLPATNRRGRAIEVRVQCTPLLGANDNIDGVILVQEPVEAS
jgi:two-component system CheB/CheR fusion protein